MTEFTILSCDGCGSALPKKPKAAKRTRNKHFFCSTVCSYAYHKAERSDLRGRIAALFHQGKTVREIDAALGITTACFHLKQLGLSRSRSAARRNSDAKRFRDVELPCSLVEVIEGNLLGDGYVGEKSARSGFYAHATKHRAQIVWLRRMFDEAGIGTSKIYVRPAHYGFGGKSLCKESYSFKSEALPAFRQIRERWYEGKKVVPADLTLTAVKVLHWYLGDGTLYSVGGRPRVRFASQGFTHADNHLLIDKLSSFCVQATLPKVGNGSGVNIAIRSRSVDSFFDLIGDCPVELFEAYGHKWPVSRGGNF